LVTIADTGSVESPNPTGNGRFVAE